MTTHQPHPEQQPELPPTTGDDDVVPESPREAITATSTEDVLAYIHCTLGFYPKNSMVLVAFCDDTLSTVVRCELPETIQYMLRVDTPESVTFMDTGVTESQELFFGDTGRRLAALLGREPSTTQCLVIYLPETVTVSDQHALAVVGTANSMMAPYFGLRHVPVDTAWLIHHDRVWHLRCAATTGCTTQGKELTDITQTRLYQQLSPTGTVASDDQVRPPDLTFPPGLPKQTPGPPDRRGFVDTVTETLCSQRPHLVKRWLAAWDAYLTQGPSMLSTSQVAELLAAVEYPTVRDTIIATACFDVPTAVHGMIAAQLLPEHMADSVAASSRTADLLDIHNCLLGQSQRAPDWQRIAHLEALCRRLLPLADQTSGGPIAGMRAWIEWVRGRGTIALRYVEQARPYFPTEALLQRLEGLLYQGAVANWATRLETSWRPQLAR